VNSPPAAERLKKLVEKLKTSKGEVFEKYRKRISYVDDIKVDEEIIKSFEKTMTVSCRHRLSYRSPKDDGGPKAGSVALTQNLRRHARRNRRQDRLGIMFELLKIESNSREEYQKLLSVLTDYTNALSKPADFSDTEIYNNIIPIRSPNIQEEASGMIRLFRSRCFS